MKRIWAVALLSLALATSPALALFPGTGGGAGGGGTPGGTSSGGGGGGGTPGGHSGGGGQVPEISPGAAASALTLLVGATLIALDRRRRTVQVEPQQS